MGAGGTTCPACGGPPAAAQAAAGSGTRCSRCGSALDPSRAAGALSPEGSRTVLASSPPSRDDRSPGVLPPPGPARWKPGDIVLDRYEVRTVHEGGMAVVYGVHDRQRSADLALKVPRRERFATQRDAENFAGEAQTWIGLGDHPHVVRCHEVISIAGLPGIVAEYVAGGSLAEWIRSRRLYDGGPRAALPRILDIAAHAARGLHHAYSKSLVHQDVKPANIMMTPDGVAKVTDFGLARVKDAGGKLGHTFFWRRRVAYAGMTPAYCSPEQARRRPLLHKTDIYSWAVSVLEMFTGGVTWMSGTAARGVLEAYLREGPPDAFLPPMPDDLVEMLRLSLHRNPEVRPRTMGDVADALRDMRRSLAGPVLKEVPLAGGRSFALSVNDIVDEPVEAIVNAADGALEHKGGVSAVIAKAAGPDFERESATYVRTHGPVPTGGTAVTGAGRLPYKGVIHAVGPRWGAGSEESKLFQAVTAALTCAHERGWRSVSFPAISSGASGVPHDVCARAYVKGVRRHFETHPDSSLREVRLCLVGPSPLADRVAAEMDAGGRTRQA